MQYCKYYYNPYMKLPCSNGNLQEKYRGDSQHITRPKLDEMTDDILKELKNQTDVDEKLQSYGISGNDNDAILRTVIRYTLGSTRIPVLPANIPVRASQLVDNLGEDNPALLRLLQKSGLNPIQSKQLLANIIIFTLQALIAPKE